MARGIPVIASNTGGLPPKPSWVSIMCCPFAQLSDTASRWTPPPFRRRKFPRRMRPWLEALQPDYYADRAHYRELSAASRQAALTYIAGVTIEPFERYLTRPAP